MQKEETFMTVVIHHNPRCSKSRQALELIREAGVEPEIKDYLKDGWTKAGLEALLAEAGLTPSDVLRKGEAQAKELGLKDADDATILEAMLAHPILVERPIVKTPKGVRLCRPPERVKEILS